MTNTKFRKRMLISSVAMLLVALVALGSATFAWFTQNTTAYANDIHVKALKSSNLVVSKVSGDTGWASTINYEVASAASPKTFYPASSTNGTNWVKAIASASDNYAKNSDAPTTVSAPVMNNAASSSYAYLSMLNVKNDTETGGAAINNVTISWDALGSYSRIALVPADSTGAALTGTGNGFANNVYALDTTEYTALGGATTSTELAITPKSDTSLNIGTLNAGDAKYFLLYVWFEGQDTDCKDTGSGQQINLSFTVQGTPAN